MRLITPPRQKLAAIDSRISAVLTLERLAGCCIGSGSGDWQPAYLTTGGCSNVWNGAGDGIVHSRPCAFSQTCAVAFGPPLMHLTYLTLKS